jgi:hypothetical protein
MGSDEVMDPLGYSYRRVFLRFCALRCLRLEKRKERSFYVISVGNESKWLALYTGWDWRERRVKIELDG